MIIYRLLTILTTNIDYNPKMFDRYFTAWNNIHHKIYVPYTIDADNGHKFDSTNEWDVLNMSDVLIFGRNFEDKIKYKCVTVEESVNIADFIEESAISNKHLLIEIGSGYTGLPLELLSRSKFDIVISYASDDKELDMLRRNINTYKYGKKSITAGQWDGSVVNFPGCIIIISTIVVVKNNIYVDSALKVDIADFFEMHKGIAHIIAVKGNIHSIDGWSKTPVDAYTVFLNTTGLVDADGGGLQPIITRAQITSAIPMPKYETSIFEHIGERISIEIQPTNFTKLFIDRRSKSKWSELINELPRAPTNVKPATKEWLDAFKEYLSIFLYKLTYGDKELESVVPGMITDTAVKKYWLLSMIHQSANAENNYESLETFGDEFLNTSFFAYTAERFPRMTPEEFTSLKHEYLSVDKQPLFTKLLHLHDWVISNLTVGTKIMEDVFESFCGALYFAAEDSQRNMGLAFVKLMVTIIFDDIDLYGNEDAHIGNKKMVIDNINNALFGKDRPMTYNSHNLSNLTYTFKMDMRDHAIEYFAKKGVNVSGLRKLKIFGTGKNLHDAEIDAHKRLYFALKEAGVTLAWSKERSVAKKIASDVTLANLHQRALLKARKAGYSDITIKKYESDSQYRGASLVGIKSSGKKTNLTFVQLTTKADIGGVQKDNILYGELYSKYLSK